MANRVKFLLCLAIFGMIFALFVYFGIVLPARQGLLHAPLNFDTT